MSDEKKNGQHVHIIGEAGSDLLAVRCGDEGRELMTLRKAKDGQPADELVKLTKTPHPGRYDVETLYKAAAKPPPSGPKLGHAGPARVVSEAYRDGWESIFGAKKPAPSAPN